MCKIKGLFPRHNFGILYESKLGPRVQNMGGRDYLEQIKVMLSDQRFWCTKTLAKVNSVVETILGPLA